MQISSKSVLLLLLIFSFNTTQAQDSLKVLSYNIQGMKPGTSPEFRLTHIIDELKNLDPDIIALQEINQAVSGNGDGDDNQGMAIKNALSEHFGLEYHYYQQFTHLSWDNELREYVGIVSKHPIVAEGFSQLATGVFPRKVVWNFIDTPIGLVNVFSTHLSFNSSGVRLQQAQQIDTYLNTIEENNIAVNSFLCGDFNDAPNAGSITFLTGMEADNGYSDSHPIANPGMAGNTVPSDGPNRRIDYIFYRNNENEGGLVSSETVMGGTFTANFYRSDHLGVLSIFTAQPNATIDINSSSNQLSIYPNPSTDLLELICEETMIQLVIFDMNGRLIKEKTIASKEFKLDISDISKGTYTLKILTTKGELVHQFIKI